MRRRLLSILDFLVELAFTAGAALAVSAPICALIWALARRSP
jgi:hypothetical protein